MLLFLKKHSFVSVDTDIKDFRKIFNNTQPEILIHWTGNISELAYFIKVLHNDLKLIKDIQSHIWKVTANCFVDKNKQTFDWEKFRGQKKPAKAILLEKAANIVK
ncbi:MAG: hypothetical protein WC223_06225 [Bacteroidales bacterium]